MECEIRGFAEFWHQNQCELVSEYVREFCIHCYLIDWELYWNFLYKLSEIYYDILSLLSSIRSSCICSHIIGSIESIILKTWKIALLNWINHSRYTCIWYYIISAIDYIVLWNLINSWRSSCILYYIIGSIYYIILVIWIISLCTRKNYCRLDDSYWL